MNLRPTFAAAVLATAAVAAGAPAAHASTTPWATSPLGLGPGGTPGGGMGLTGCGPAHGREGQGGTGANEHTVCSGAGLVFIGPSMNIANVIGPTIIAPGFAGLVVVANGPAAVGP